MLKQIDYDQLPKHIAFIMDGNGRWAKKRFLPHSSGHKAGANALKALAEECDKMGIEYISVYAFSTENWQRPQDEVDYLMALLNDYIQQYIDDSDKNNMRMSVIGNMDMLDKELYEKIQYLTDYTKNKAGLHMVIALSYGGRDEIVRAVKKMAVQIEKGAVHPEDIQEDLFSRYLDTCNIPDPELLIRTSGEMRLSNFLLWQTAYTEMYFCEKLWPDFTIQDLKTAILDYQSRNRRFGKR